ncbi:ABC-2 type transport system ATP-binding protein [Bathymodiolus platifrons methanotrophic gill symbiont]|uniref:ABC transporter ATP-binding protein n=1 Tax=Bathymodiolus platifrons methanotrophic gill symbiont TaxID=113268 RepID=UPI000B411880|nr:ABC transporter ATP-binding protein [Bathymodiolus platifrons methanotrophic gill symbiont]MCK5871058.1 ATP-binding cassette domain-containing protein [Methyloprofundus sp.]TXK98733.1 ABC transporter ATP-binding protein [Methylococcaceae bacterium CS4]TXL00077.1 ABC transporter ATP-binding protein [Methylococcaceae bacterium CS5]TXL00615.1 ABC transporter ATP-binding protein [Methylococcaceae bacterium HT1]TXL06053.1 ABC transporter ATP-binding protein [Methylococcaceae bacterium CS1]TXL06
MAKHPALAITDLSFSYGKKQVLHDLSLIVEEGQCCILLGPNGAGKSTLFSLITRLYAHKQGDIQLAGFNIQKRPLKALAQLGVVFQQTTLDLDLTVQQNLRYHAALQGISSKKANLGIQEQLERLGMYERRKEVVRQLNGGHRRRVEIARALMHKPSVLLLDEPTVGLDAPSRQAIVDHVHQLVEDGSLAVLWATHLMDEIYASDKVVLIHHGSVKAEGGVTDIIQQAQADNINDAFFKLTQGKS